MQDAGKVTTMKALNEFTGFDFWKIYHSYQDALEDRGIRNESALQDILNAQFHRLKNSPRRMESYLRDLIKAGKKGNICENTLNELIVIRDKLLEDDFSTPF